MRADTRGACSPAPSRVWSLCRELDQTALIVTHDERLCACADRVMTMVNGEIVREKVNAHAEHPR
ncbi:MAG: hypothetical protein MJ192_07770 [Clostridia bacterium]|nr:hypothetical protein [Clostridia bacterium]